MHGFLKLCNAMYWLALTMWIAALVSAGIAAMNVFGMLSKTPMRLEPYQAFPAESHGRLAAGKVMEGVFFSVDVIQFVAAPVAGIALLIQFVVFGLPGRSPANVIRSICVVGAILLFAFHATMLAPAMNRELRQYWKAAEAGDKADALIHLDTFNVSHSIAEALMQTNLVLLLIAVTASAAALGPHRTRQSELHIPNLMRMR